jgi:hypothetical protein
MGKKITSHKTSLTKIVKKIIKEQRFSIISKLLRNSGDDFIKKFGDDVATKIDDVLANALSKSVNVGVNKNGKQFLRSLRGSEVEIDTIKGVLNTVEAGGDINELAILLPERLADGTEFRTILQNEISKKIGKTTLIRLGQQGEIYKKLLNDLSNFVPIVSKGGNSSGWKLHIFTTTVDETAYALEKVVPIIKKYGAGAKAASSEKLERLSKDSLQKGKGITIYIPPSVIQNRTQRDLLKEIQEAIKDLNTSGSISGDQMITKNIGYRYELTKPINPKIGVDEKTYYELYSPNDGGPYNLPNNVDIFDY